MRRQGTLQDRHIEGNSWTKNFLYEENNMIVIRLDYQYRLPFSIFGKTSVNQFVVSSEELGLAKMEWSFRLKEQRKKMMGRWSVMGPGQVHAII